MSRQSVKNSSGWHTTAATLSIFYAATGKLSLFALVELPHFATVRPPFSLIGETWRIVAMHPLESKYGLGASELLDAIDRRFRLKVALEGAVAEVQMAKKIAPLVGSLVDRFEIHDLDGYPDFSLWLPGREEPLFAECKNVRESAKAGGEAYREPPPVVCWLS